jgi:hypothetical protein
MAVRAAAEAAGEESSVTDLSRRQLINSSIALGAAASLAPLAATQPAFAANKVLSSDWEKVSINSFLTPSGLGTAEGSREKRAGL